MDDNCDFNVDGLSHNELMELTESTLNELLAQDTFLKDLPKEVILEEVNNQIALQYGRSITVYVIKDDGEKMPVIVSYCFVYIGSLKKFTFLLLIYCL